MNTDKLIFQTIPQVTIATNTFINTPIILKYEDINLIEIIKEAELGFTTQIPIYHSDGTYLAKVVGTRMFATEEGKKAGIIVDKLKGVSVCKMGTQTLFEIYHQEGDSFKTQAELYTPDGCFVKCSDSPNLGLIDMNGQSIKVGGIHMSNCTLNDFKIGLWLKKDGSASLGVNI
jgi:hypothetical protein